MTRRLILPAALLLTAGCLYPVREKTDQVACDLVAHPFDREPPAAEPAVKPMPPAAADAAKPPTEPEAAVTLPNDVRTVALLEKAPPDDFQERLKKLYVMPSGIPGAEAPPIPQLPRKDEDRLREIRRLYPVLPPPPAAPTPLPGPDGKPYTLSDLQRIAAENSWALHQAAYAVEAARGNLITAAAYPNPTVGWEVQPSNNGSAAGVQGPFIDQTIKTGGKQTLAAAAAQKDLDNAELALRKARSDLATQVRNAYFALLAAKETVRILEALAVFTDNMYRLQVVLVESPVGAGYEPGSLLAQAYQVRLALKNAIIADTAAWQQLVAAVGLRQLPLTEVAGRVDALIPYFDYDTVRAHVLRNHTDLLTASNGIDKARYNLKLAQVTPVPDVDVNVAILKEYSLAPEKWVPTLSVGMPFPIWDHNRGGVIAAEAALGQALEEPHRVETVLTTNLSIQFAAYQSNLKSLEDYRTLILPIQARVYKTILQRRAVDLQGIAFADVATAQQALATSITTYVGLIGQVWTSAVAVADLLQTDDLFQLAQPQPLAPLTDLDDLPPLPCCHPCAGGHAACPACTPAAAPTAQPALLPMSAAEPAVAPKSSLPTSALPRPQLPDLPPTVKTAAPPASP
jgi:cobalt-zinc-cadmium efflux system outer membrane protein